MSTAPRYRPEYTVDDYARWQGDWELWDGIPVAMTPSPFGRHAQLLVRLSAWSLGKEGEYRPMAVTDSLVVDICDNCRLALDVKRMLR